jgi:hypothetical protein
LGSFRDRVKADVKSVFLGSGAFEEDIIYTVTGSSPVTISALVFDDAELQDNSSEMDGVFMPTMARPVRFDLAEADISTVTYGDTITWGGETYTVRQYSLRDGMWKVLAIADIRGEF